MFDPPPGVDLVPILAVGMDRAEALDAARCALPDGYGELFVEPKAVNSAADGPA